MNEEKPKFHIVCTTGEKRAIEAVVSNNPQKLNIIAARLREHNPTRKYSVEPVNSELSQRGDVSR
jgi:hypothetical protein